MATAKTTSQNLSFFQEVLQVGIQFVQEQFLLALTKAAVAALAFWLLGIRQAILLGAVAGLMSLIPYLGAILGFVPALIMAWISQHNWWVVGGVVGIWGLLQVLEAFVLQPKILGRKLKIHPLLVICSFFFWGALLGFWGILLAIPLTAVMQIVLRRLWQHWKNHSAGDDSPAQ